MLNRTTEGTDTRSAINSDSNYGDRGSAERERKPCKRCEERLAAIARGPGGAFAPGGHSKLVETLKVLMPEPPRG